MFASFIAFAWVGCGIIEIVTDHKWHRGEDYGFAPRPINWTDRSAKQAYLMGPLALYVGYRYRRFHDHRR